MTLSSQQSRRNSALSAFDSAFDHIRLSILGPPTTIHPATDDQLIHDFHESSIDQPTNIFESLTSSLNRLERSVSRTMQRHSVNQFSSSRSRHDALRHSILQSVPPASSRLHSLRHSSYNSPIPDSSLPLDSSFSNSQPLRPPRSVPRPFSTLFLPNHPRHSLPEPSNHRSRSASEMLPLNSRLLNVEPPSPSGDELPSYTRRAPLIRPLSLMNPATASRRSSHGSGRPHSELLRETQLKPHVIASSSGKIQLTLFSPGRSRYPVLLQGVDTELKGEVKLNLGDFGESFSEIRVKCKGVVRTLVLKQHGTSSHPMQDEVVFMHQDQTLYQPSILSATDTKLSGTIKFPFHFMIPDHSTNYTSLPPSFSLTSPGSVTESGQKTVEWGSVKYYVKVTLVRRGLLRSNERLFAPFVLLSKQIEPPITSMNRLAAFSLGLPIPNPCEDPEGWMGRKIRQHIKITGANLSRSQRSAWYEVMVLLPSPLCYGRNRPLPYFLKFTSSNTAVTTEFGESTFRVSLFQRAILSAVGMTGTHENTISHGYSKPEGHNNGITLPVYPDEHWSRRYQGELPLGNNAVPNFKCPNISIQYYFNLTVSVPGQINDLQITLPIQLVSTPGQTISPLADFVEPATDGLGFPSRLGHSPSPSISSIGPRPDMSRNSSVTAIPVIEPNGPEMPPSYFDVQEMDSRRSSGL